MSDWNSIPIDPSMVALSIADIPDADCASPLEISAVMDMLEQPVIPRRSKERPPVSALSYHCGRPLLLPEPIASRIDCERYALTLNDCSDSALQYAYLSLVKNSGGEHNTIATDLWYRRHLFRSRQLMSKASGLTLDIGCDDPAQSRRLFPAGVRYIGLDPGLGPRREACLLGMAEFLPFKDGSLDSVAFLTSLDHVLDYAAALDEAHRVLRPGGRLYVATLIWTHDADLIHDTIHFHHFRQYEIEGALKPFQIEKLTRYAWKGDAHRFGVYLVAAKPDLR